MLISRRHAIASFVAVSAGLCRRAKASSAPRLMIVTTSREGPHAAATEGMQQAFASRSIGAALFQLPADDASMRRELGNGANQLAIAVGVTAVRAVASANSHMPLLATMAFRADIGSLRASEGAPVKLAGAVWLDLPVAEVIGGLRTIFPAAARIGIVRNTSHPDVVEALNQSHPLPGGVSLKPIECASAAELLASMQKLRGQFDFLICLPDSDLYNKTTVEPLILASLEHKLPLVGFSASFVRAGAAVGVYPDFAEVGRQTAALSERFLTGAQGSRDEYPRRTAVAVNERVMHLLGREYKPKQGEEVLVIR